MAAERARQAQQLEAFVNQNAARPCTPSTVLREARVRHGYDVSYLLRATAPPSGPALPPSRRSPSRHQFGRLNIAAAAASGCSGSGPAASGTGHAAFGREEEVDGEDLDEADLRMLDAGFAGEGDGWRGDPRQRRGPRLPATITIKAPAPHRFGSLVSARSTRLGPHIDSPPPAARPTPFASGTKRISFACVPDATAAGLSGPGGPSGTGSSGSCGGSKVTRAPASVAVLMDRSHRASPLPSACSSPVPPSAAFAIARRRSIDPQLSVVGGRANSRAGSGSLAQRHSQSGAAQQLHVHVIGPVASPAAAAATEAAAVSRMTRVMRAESRKGPADQDWTLDPEAVAAHAARVLGAASADQVPVAAAGTAAFGRGHCPQPQRLPFLPGVSRLQSKLTPGGPQQQPAAGGLPAAAVSGGGTGGAHVPPTSAGSWSASAAAAATTCAAATRGPISPAGVMRQQQQMASSRPVTSGARLNATPSNAQGVSPPPSPPLTAKSSGRSHKRAGTATAAAAATAAGHAMPPGAATAAGHAASCRGSAAPFGTGREGPTADCASSGRGADAAAPVAAAATAQSVEMEERASILLRIKNALSFLHRDE
eukprot:XP_001696054.1 predicted protein [Chlamydomonas reinhardtii]